LRVSIVSRATGGRYLTKIGPCSNVSCASSFQQNPDAYAPLENWLDGGPDRLRRPITQAGGQGRATGL
jgi:hypothetical protein